MLSGAVGAAVPDRLRQHRQPAAGSRRPAGRASWLFVARLAPDARGSCGSCSPSRSSSRRLAARWFRARHRSHGVALTRYRRRRRCRCSPRSGWIGPLCCSTLALSMARTGHLRRFAGAHVVAANDGDRAQESPSRDTRWLRNLLVRRGRPLDRARGRRRAAGAQPGASAEVDPGFDQEHVVTFTMTLPTARYPAARRASGVRRDGAAAARAAWRAGGRRRQHAGAARIHLDRRRHSRRARRRPTTSANSRHMSITPATSARWGSGCSPAGMFNEEIRVEKPPVTIVNESLARQYFRGAVDTIRRQAHHLRTAAGQRAVDHHRRRRRRRKAGRPGRAGGADEYRASGSGCRTR